MPVVKQSSSHWVMPYAVGSSIGAAVATCVPAPPADAPAVAPGVPVMGAVPVTGGHPATTAAVGVGHSAYSTARLWGLEANKWFHMKAKNDDGKGIFGKYMAPAAAGAVGFVLLSIVAMSVRLMFRRANARASAPAVSAREDAELLEELGE